MPPFMRRSNNDLPPSKHGLTLDKSSTIGLRAFASILVFCEIVSLFLLLFIGYKRDFHQIINQQITHFTFSTSVFDAICISFVRVIITWLQACDDDISNWGKFNFYFGPLVLIFTIIKSCLWHNWQDVTERTFLIVLLVSSVIQVIQTWRIHRRIWQKRSNASLLPSELTQPLTSETKSNDNGDDEPKELSTNASLGRLLSLAGPEKWLLILGTIALFFSSGATMVVPALFGALIRTISTNTTSSPEDIARSQTELNHVTIMLVVFFALTSIFTFLRGSLFTLAGERLVARFRKRLFAALTRADISFFDKTQSGELVNRLASDSAVIQNAVTVNISMALRFVAQFVVGIILLFVLSPELTGIMLASVPAVVIGAVAYGRFVRKIGKQYQKALANAGEVASEVLGNVRTVRSFGKEQSELHRVSGMECDNIIFSIFNF